MNYNDIIKKLDNMLLPQICTDSNSAKLYFYHSYQHSKAIALDPGAIAEEKEKAMAELNNILHIYMVCK